MTDLNRDESKKIGAWFLGPQAENSEIEEELLNYILRDYFHWRRNYYPGDEVAITRGMRREFEDWNDTLFQQVSETLACLRRNFPFYSPRYLAHMLSDQTIPSVLGYFAGMLYNPNNVTPEAAPVTVEWELEVASDILEMLGYKTPPKKGAGEREAEKEYGWAHITSGGTIANIEALWVARNVRYFPIAVKYALKNTEIRLEVKLPGTSPNETKFINDLSDLQVLGIKPNESIYLLARYIDAIRKHFNLSPNEASDKGWDMLRKTGFSLAHNGTAACFSKWQPVIFVSGTAHYSISKAAELLGIGKDNVQIVEENEAFRIDLHDLELKIRNVIRRGQLPLAVIGIAGTTEEGAVDSIHDINDLRTKIENETGQSFWLHIDAAWGGYIRSVFQNGEKDKDGDNHTLDQRIDEVNKFVSRRFRIQKGKFSSSIHIQWGSRAVCSAFLAFPKAESITVDPHKMGYVPYPCGIISFRNDRVRHFLTQEAPYITITKQSNVQTQIHKPPKTVGPFILEGSKPGAAAVALRLSHKMIPPNRSGHGEIIRASLLAARELYERLVHWETN